MWVLGFLFMPAEMHRCVGSRAMLLLSAREIVVMGDQGGGCCWMGLAGDVH
jgi:hypothetical protein